jgi:hypothetical protein
MKNVELPHIEQPKLPSHHQIGDYVHLVVTKSASHLDKTSILWHGRVTKVHFDPGKVTYDLEFTVTIDAVNKKRYVTRVHNVDGALCCSVKEYEDSKAEETESPFNHGGWHNSTEFPKPNYKEWVDEGGPTYSEDVLIDIDGYRKRFRVGWYDFEDKQWNLYDLETGTFEVDNLRWTCIPLAR